MKFALVTSQTTYIPGNSFPFFEKIIESEAQSFVGIIMVQNLSFDIIKTTLWLYIVGCYRLAMTLTKNILAVPLKKRECLFAKHNIPVIKVKTINDLEVVSWIEINNIDIVINFRSRGIVKHDALSTPRLGWINLHHGILPTYRGLFCDLFALTENRQAGFSIHKMEEGIDNGNIYLTKVVSTPGEKNYCAYLSRLALPEAKAVLQVMTEIKNKSNLPSGTANITEEAIITKTPSGQELKKMRLSGMIL